MLKISIMSGTNNTTFNKKNILNVEFSSKKQIDKDSSLPLRSDTMLTEVLTEEKRVAVSTNISHHSD